MSSSCRSRSGGALVCAITVATFVAAPPLSAQDACEAEGEGWQETTHLDECVNTLGAAEICGSELEWCGAPQPTYSRSAVQWICEEDGKRLYRTTEFKMVVQCGELPEPGFYCYSQECRETPTCSSIGEPVDPDAPTVPLGYCGETCTALEVCNAPGEPVQCDDESAVQAYEDCDGDDDDCDGDIDSCETDPSLCTCVPELPDNAADDDEDGAPDENDTIAEKCKKCGGCGGRPVHLRTREMFVGPHVDVEVDPPWQGALGLQVSRLYDSTRAKRDWRELASATDEDPTTMPNRRLPHVLGPGWRHSYEERLVLDCQRGAVNCDYFRVTYQGFDEVVLFERETPGSTRFVAEPGSAHQLELRVGSDPTGSEDRWVLRRDDGLRLLFQRAPDTELHPWGCGDCDSGNGPSTKALNAARLIGIYPSVVDPMTAGDRMFVRLEYEDQLADIYQDSSRICGALLTDGTGCDSLRGLLARVSLVVDRLGVEDIIGGLDFIYERDAGTGWSPYRLAQLRTSMMGDPRVIYAHNQSGVAAVFDRQATAASYMKSYSYFNPYNQSTADDYGLLSVVRTQVKNEYEMTAGAVEEEFVWSLTASDKDLELSLVSAHTSRGVHLEFVGENLEAGTVTWSRNGVDETTVFDADGNPTTCSSGACGESTSAWQKASDPGAIGYGTIALGLAAQLQKSGVWTLRHFDERGLVDVEIEVDSALASPRLHIERYADHDQVWVEDLTGTRDASASILRATRYYYATNRRLWVVADHRRSQSESEVRFPVHGATGQNWFYVGTLADRLLPSNAVVSHANLAANRHDYEVTVYDADSDHDKALNEEEDDRVVWTEVASTTEEGTGVLVSTSTATWDRIDTLGRVYSTLQYDANRVLRTVTEFAYFSTDDAAWQQRGRLKSVGGTGALAPWTACGDVTAYDALGHLTCWEMAQGPHPVRIEVTEGRHLPDDDGWVTTTTHSVDGVAVLTTEQVRMSSGFLLETRTVGGNRTVYRAAHTEDPTWAGVPSIVKTLDASGATLATKETEYGDYGRVARERVWAGAIDTTEVGRTTYFYVPGEADALLQTRWNHYGSGLTAYHTTQYAYDSFDRLKEVIEPDGTVVSYEVGEIGDMGAVGKILRVSRGQPGSPIVVQKFGYTPVGQLAWVNISNPIGTGEPPNQVDLTYDPAGRVTKESAPTARRDTEHTYDDGGRVLTTAVRSRASGALVSKIQNEYDDLGRLVATCDVTNGSCSLSPPASGEVVYVYDEKIATFLGTYELGTSAFSRTVSLTNNYQQGRIAHVEDEGGMTFYEYDPLGRVIAEIRYEGHPSGALDSARMRAIEYEYGAGGVLTKVRYPSGRIAEYIYGADKRHPSKVKVYRDPSGGVPDVILSGAEADAFGNPAAWSWGGIGGGSRVVTRDWLGRITAIAASYSNGQHVNANYAYDQDGDVTSEREGTPIASSWLSTGTSAWEATDYGYWGDRDMLQSWETFTGPYSLRFHQSGRRDQEVV